MATPAASKAMQVPPPIKKKDRSRQPPSIIHGVIKQPPEYQLQGYESPSSTEDVNTPQTSIHTVQNHRRPIKKRMRPQTQQEQSPKLLMQAATIAASSNASATTTSRQPENLQEDPPLPGRSNYHSNKVRQPIEASFFSPSPFGDAMDSDSGSGSVAVSVKELLTPLATAVVTPPRGLQRNKTSFFPLTWEQKALVQERFASVYEMAFQDLPRLATPPRTQLPAFLSCLPGAGKDIVAKKIVFEECFDDDDDEEEEERPIGDSALRDMFKAIQNKVGIVTAPTLQALPPKLTSTESESMCIMMKGLLEPSKRSFSLESHSDNQPKKLSRENGLLSPLQAWQNSSDDIMEGAFSTMQQEMIATPKKPFHPSGSSFSSFASSASGSSRSSCVTPSPAKRLMTSALKRDGDCRAPPFGHRPSQSLGSLGSYEASGSTTGSMMSAPRFPELGDPVAALDMVSKRYWLTEKEKVDRAKQYIKIPPKLKPKPKLPPLHVGRTPSGNKNLRKNAGGHSQGRFGYKRSISEETKRGMKMTRGSQSPAALKQLTPLSRSDAVDPSTPMKPRVAPKGKEHRSRHDLMKDDLLDCVASTRTQASPHVPSNSLPRDSLGSSISWIEHQEQMFNPYEVFVASGSTKGVDSGSPEEFEVPAGRHSLKKSPRRISQF